MYLKIFDCGGSVAIVFRLTNIYNYYELSFDKSSITFSIKLEGNLFHITKKDIIFDCDKVKVKIKA